MKSTLKITKGPEHILIVIRHLSCICFTIYLMGCGATATPPPPSVTNDDALPTKQHLLNQLREYGEMWIVYPAGGAEIATQYQEHFNNLSRRARRGLNMTIKSCHEVTPKDLAEHPIWLVGAASSHTWLQQPNEKFPFQRNSEQGIEFDRSLYQGSSDVLHIGVYPNPWNPQLPMSILTGNDDAAILALLNASGRRRRLSWGGWGYQLFRNGQRVIMGDFSEEADTRWEMDRRVHWDFQARGNEAVYESRNFSFYADTTQFPLIEIQSLAENCEASVKNVLDFMGVPASHPSFELSYYLYRSSEEKGLHIGNSTQAHADLSQRAIYTVKSPYFPGHRLQKENELILQLLPHSSQHPLMREGLALQFTPNWKEKGFRYWGKRLAQAELLPNPEELFFPSTPEAQSPLIQTCAAGLWVDFLLQAWGKETFLEKYPSWQPDRTLLRKLTTQWHTYLNQLPEAPIQQATHTPPSFYKGFNFAHEGYSIYNGYGSAKSAISIEYINDLGSNSIAIIPYSWMPNPQQAVPLRFSDGPGSENDEGVIHAARTAQDLGMHSLLKPQIWFRGSWPGELKMRSPKEWEQFFEYYEHWIGHYALLAEMEGIDMLCVGVEFVHASLTQEKRWRSLMQQLRKVYSGPMVYCANWGEEFEKMKFWDEFDYLGISCYYPMSKSDNPSDKELLKNFERSLDKIEAVSKKFDKPVLFTEIGYRSVSQPWKNPYAEIEGRAHSTTDQARCYRIVSKALKDENWCKGIYWWKWPSYLEHNHGQDRDYAPLGKEAEQVLKEWWGR